jgi:hypothetical protein
MISQLEYMRTLLNSDGKTNNADWFVPNIPGIPSIPIGPIVIPEIIIPPLDLNLPGFYHGTEKLKGASGIDNILIRANVDERILPSYMNNKLGEISNEELVKAGLMYKSNQFNVTQLPQFNYNMDFPKVENENKKLIAEVKMLRKEMANIKQVNVNVVNGNATVSERQKDRTVKHIGSKFKV